jgi:hypothetical protein
MFLVFPRYNRDRHIHRTYIHGYKYFLYRKTSIQELDRKISPYSVYLASSKATFGICFGLIVLFINVIFHIKLVNESQSDITINLQSHYRTCNIFIIHRILRLQMLWSLDSFFKLVTHPSLHNCYTISAIFVTVLIFVCFEGNASQTIVAHILGNRFHLRNIVFGRVNIFIFSFGEAAHENAQKTMTTFLSRVP